MKQTLYVFDVDGTLIRSDSLLLLFRYHFPSASARLIAFIRLLPFVAFSICKRDGSVVKRKMLSLFWQGWKKGDIESQCNTFFEKSLRPDISPAAVAYIARIRQESASVPILLLSASCREWLQPLSVFLQADLVCTEILYDEEERFTGKLASKNCKGREKKRRLLEKYPAANFEFICFGDSKADKALESVSKEFKYRYF